MADRNSEQLGFTLIELMVTLAILAILAAIALPMYSDNMTRGKIASATTPLSQGYTNMEQWFQDNRTYVGGPCPASTGSFALTCSTPSATTFQITATGTGGMTGFTYTIDQGISTANVLTRATPVVPSAYGPASTNCWITGPGGKC